MKIEIKISASYTILIFSLFIIILSAYHSAIYANEEFNNNQGQWEVYSSPIYLAESSFLGLDMISSNEGWAVGSNGVIVHYSDSKWSVVPSPIITTLNDVSMISSTEGWAVGDEGVILYYDGNQWSQFTSPTDCRLKSISMVSSTEGWAIGYKVHSGGSDENESIFIRYDGISWKIFKTEKGGNRGNLQSIQMLSENDGWAVGGARWMFHYDGSDWLLTSVSSKYYELESLHFSSSNDGWAIGSYLGFTYFFHWNGSNWSKVDGPEQIELQAVYMVSENNGWVTCENGLLLHYDGTEWEIADRHPGCHCLNALEMLSINDGWAVGVNGTIMHYDGACWQVVHESAPSSEIFKGIYILSKTEAWAVGEVDLVFNYWEGMNLIFHFDGSLWRGVGYIPSMQVLSDVDMISTADVWAVGYSGCIAHYNGNVWSIVNSPTSASLNSIDMVSSTSGYIVGDNGIILKYSSSGEWQTMWSPTDYDLESIYMNSENDGWIVGRKWSRSESKGVILRFDGSNWNINAGLPGGGLPGQTLYSVFCLNANDCWAVGGDGIILHYNGSEWSEAASPTGSLLREVYMLNPNDGWAVGYNGTLLHYDGNFWSKSPCPVNSNLYSISALKVNNSFVGWAVGEHGVILNYNVPVSVDNKSTVNSSNDYSLYQNFPNPFNPTTEIRYHLSIVTDIELIIYNHLGQIVLTLVDQIQPAGDYNIKWNGCNNEGKRMSSGVYFYQLKSSSFMQTRKMLLLR